MDEIDNADKVKYDALIKLINEKNKNLNYIKELTNQIIEILKIYSLIIKSKKYKELLKILNTKLHERQYIDGEYIANDFGKFIKEIENSPWKCTRCGGINKGLSPDSMCFYCGRRIDPVLQFKKSKKSKSKKSKSKKSKSKKSKSKKSKSKKVNQETLKITNY